MESEKVLERKLDREVKKRGGISIKILSTYIAGLPDRLCLLPGGKFFFAEIKTTGEKPSKIQLLMHAKFQRLGFPVAVIDSTFGVNELIKEHE